MSCSEYECKDISITSFSFIFAIPAPSSDITCIKGEQNHLCGRYDPAHLRFLNGIYEDNQRTSRYHRSGFWGTLTS